MAFTFRPGGADQGRPGWFITAGAEERNPQVRKARRGKNGPSAAVGDVTGSGRASVASSNPNGEYRLLIGCRTSSSAVEQRELRSLGRRSSSNREGASRAPQTDAPERSSERSGTTVRLLETRSSNRGRENDERFRERDQP